MDSNSALIGCPIRSSSAHLRPIHNPDHDDREHCAVEAPDGVEGNAVGEPGEKDRDKDQHPKQLHCLVIHRHQGENNETPINQLPNRFGVNEVVPSGVDLVVNAARFNRWLHQIRLKQNRDIEANPQQRGDDGDPFQTMLQRSRVNTSTDRPGTPWNPDHPEAIGEEQKPLRSD